MKLIFMGTPDFAVPCLERLIEAGHEIAAVFSQPDKPRGRKIYSSVLYDSGKSVPHSCRLLMDLFYHEVLISALFRSRSIPGYMRTVHADFIAVQVEEVDLTRKQSYGLKIIDIVNISCVLKYCRYI